MYQCAIWSNTIFPHRVLASTTVASLVSEDTVFRLLWGQFYPAERLDCLSMLICFKPLGKILHDMLMLIGAIRNDLTMTYAKRTGIAVGFPDNGHYVPKPIACLRRREALSELKTVQCYKML